MNKRQIIAALVEKTGIKIDEHDPAFLLVDINLLMLESQTSIAAKQLDAATQNFNTTVTRSIDDFVAVANEALAKFIQRTNELKATLDVVEQAPLIPITTPTLPTMKHTIDQPRTSNIWLPVIAIGVICVVTFILALLFLPIK